jgi:hypothetical protein
MRSAARALALGLSAIAATACHRLPPPAEPPYTITGVVESIDAGALAVRHKSGQRVTIAFATGTAVSRNDSPAAVTDIAVGMRIVVFYRLVGGVAIADKVHLFRPAIKAPVEGGLLLS